jgi:hypothetical protein
MPDPDLAPNGRRRRTLAASARNGQRSRRDRAKWLPGFGESLDRLGRDGHVGERVE